MIFVLGIVVFYLLVQYNLESTLRDSIFKTTELASEAALIEAQDGSLRVKESGMTLYDLKYFESTFKNSFEKYATFNSEKVSLEYRFEYFIINSEGVEEIITSNNPLNDNTVVKAVTTIVIADGNEYKIRNVFDITEGRVD